MVRVPFHKIRVNKRGDTFEIVFPFGDQWWALDWDKVSSRFKRLYVVYLKLTGAEVPDYLKDYEVSTISVDDVSIPIDLGKCRQVPENYPLGV